VNDSPQNDRDVDRLERVVDYSHRAIDRVQAVYKWLASLVAVVIAVGLAAATYLTYHNIADLRKDMKEERADEEVRLKADLEQKSKTLGDEVNKRIDSEFSRENVRQMVEQKARERIDTIADTLIQKQIKGIIDPQLTEIKGRVDNFDAKIRTNVGALEDTLKKGQSATQEIKSGVDFVLLTVRAANDDRHAFDELLSIEQTGKPPLSDTAYAATVEIATGSLTDLIHYNVDWPAIGVKPETASIKEFEGALSSDILPGQRPAILEAMWGQSRFSKFEKLTFLEHVIRTTSSLRCLVKATRLMDQEANLKKNIRVYSLYLDWYRDHISEYVIKH
jgi:hypothetical protein